MIHNNGSIIRDHIAGNNSVPVGRKPALPPKPPNPLRLSLLKPKGYSCITAKCNGKSTKMKLDPAELSLKERLALFEKSRNAELVPEALGHQTELKMSVPIKTISINTKRKELYTSLPHTSNLIKAIHQRKTIICGNFAAERLIFPNQFQIKIGFPVSHAYSLIVVLFPDINIDSDVDDSPTVIASKSIHDIEKYTESEVGVEHIESPTTDMTDGEQKSSRKILHNDTTRSTEFSQPSKTELHIDGMQLVCDRMLTDAVDSLRLPIPFISENTTCTKAYSREAILSKYTHDIRLYGDLTPIVTTIAPSKMNPSETIGLNDLHPSNYSLLNEVNNQYQPKEEDRWDRFIECLLFFCCVA